MDHLDPDTWHRRDLPVLRIAVRLHDDAIGGAVRVDAIESDTDLSEDDVQRALHALAAGQLIRTDGSMQKRHMRVTQVSADARRHVGAWPTPETALDRMIAALEAIAEHTDDEDTRTNARKTADWFRRSVNTVGLAVAGAAISGQLPT